MRTIQRINRIGALLLALVMAFAVIPAAAFGAGEDGAGETGCEVIEAKLPDGAEDAPERSLSTHGSQALCWTPDENGAYYGDYIIIYNPDYTSGSKESGNLNGKIDKTVVEHLSQNVSAAPAVQEPDSDDLIPYSECRTLELMETQEGPDPAAMNREYAVKLSFSVGSKRTFTLDSDSCPTSNNKVEFECLAVGEHCYIWTPTDTTANRFFPLDLIDSGYAKTFADEFDSKFSTMKSSFGDHWNGSLGDGKVHLMFYNLKDSSSGNTLAGFFAPNDYTNNNLPMINIDTYPMLCKYENNVITAKPASRQFNTVVHEYQHQIHYSVCHAKDKNKESWLTEMMSAAAEEICYPGSSVTARICSWLGKSFSKNIADDPLFECANPGNAPQNGQGLYTWDRSASGNDSLSQYAKVSLYAQYLYTHSGNGNMCYKQILELYANNASYTSGDAMNAYLSNVSYASGTDMANLYFWISTVMNPSSGYSVNGVYNRYGFKTQPGYDPSKYYGLENPYDLLCPLVGQNTMYYIKGGAAVVIKPKDGRFVPPYGASSGLRYVGVFTNERLYHDTVAGYIGDATYILTDATGHPWVYSDGAAKSTNAGIRSSTGWIAYSNHTERVGAIRFRCKVEGEGSGSNFYDGLKVYLNQRSDAYLQLKIANTDGAWKDYEIVVPDGESVSLIFFEYAKDANIDPSGDCAYVDDVEFITDIDYQLKAGYLKNYAHFTTSGSYRWVYSDGCVMSTNSGEPGTDCILKCTVTANAGDVFFFSYCCYGEESSTGIVYDGLEFRKDSQLVFRKGVVDSMSGYYVYFYSSGSYTFSWNYTKDQSDDPPKDYAQLFKAYVLTPSSSEEIDKIEINGYSTPSEGDSAYDLMSQITLPGNAKYKIVRMQWYCDSDSEFIPNYRTFAAGKTYSLMICLTPKTTEHFAEYPTVFINNTVTELDMGNSHFSPGTGQYIVWTEQYTVPSILLGDVNRDGDVTVLDAVLTLRNAMNIIEFDSDQRKRGDVNGDGSVSILDAVMILRYAMGIITEF